MILNITDVNGVAVKRTIFFLGIRLRHGNIFTLIQNSYRSHRHTQKIIKHEICLETGQIGFRFGSNHIIVRIFECKLSRKPFFIENHVSSPHRSTSNAPAEFFREIQYIKSLN